MSRTKRIRTVLAAGGLVLALSACTPQWYIQHVFGASAPQAKRVAWCESRHDPGARSPGGGNHGLFQINNVHRENFTRVTGRPWSAVYDPYWNTVYAKHLYDTQGWRPWTCRP
jgi:hypothetical protein